MFNYFIIQARAQNALLLPGLPITCINLAFTPATHTRPNKRQKHSSSSSVLLAKGFSGFQLCSMPVDVQCQLLSVLKLAPSRQCLTSCIRRIIAMLVWMQTQPALLEDLMHKCHLPLDCTVCEQSCGFPKDTMPSRKPCTSMLY